MKNNSKKIILSLVAVIMSVALLFSFTACNQTPDIQKGEKNVTLVIVDTENRMTVVSDDTDCVYVDKWLEELYSEGKITLSFETGTYGMDIRTLNGIEVNGSTKYFAFFADDADNTNPEWGTYVYNNITCASCMFGQSQMPLKNGCTYVLIYSEYNS